VSKWTVDGIISHVKSSKHLKHSKHSKPKVWTVCVRTLYIIPHLQDSRPEHPHTIVVKIYDITIRFYAFTILTKWSDSMILVRSPRFYDFLCLQSYKKTIAHGHFAKKTSRGSRKPPSPYATHTQRHYSSCENDHDLGQTLDLCFGVEFF
jgi:hypothetical protein